MTFSEKQKGVLTGVAMAGIVTVLAVGGAIWFGPFPFLPDDTTQGRLAVWTGCSLAVVFWLILAIGVLARHRFFHAEDIDGSGLTEGSTAVAVKQAILQNTLEQGGIALMVYGAFAVLAPLSWVSAVPVAALLFFGGRLLFWRGYAGGAASRALGFALTFYPTVLLFVLLVVRLVMNVMV